MMYLENIDEVNGKSSILELAQQELDDAWLKFFLMVLFIKKEKI